MGRLSLSLLLALSPTPGLPAEGNWEWLSPGGSVAPRAAMQVSDEAVCVSEIMKAQKEYGIPSNLLLAIGLQETGTQTKEGLMTVWPWSVNAAGSGKWFSSKDDALAWAESRRSEGIKSIDLGCMQINQKWHPDAFRSFTEAFDPRKNVRYAAELLVKLRESTGSWEVAAASYHSFTPELRKRYFTSLKNKIAYAEKHNSYFQNMSRNKGFLRNAPARKDVPSASIWPSDHSNTKSTRSEGAAALFGQE